MRKSTKSAFVVAVGIIVVMSLAGCQEQNLQSAKKSRFIAEKNIQLKKQLKQRDKEIERQKQLLAKRQQEKKNLEGVSKEGVENLIGTVFKGFSEENMRLQRENEELKAQVENLKKELAELKNPKAPKPM